MFTATPVRGTKTSSSSKRQTPAERRTANGRAPSEIIARAAFETLEGRQMFSAIHGGAAPLVDPTPGDAIVVDADSTPQGATSIGTFGARGRRSVKDSIGGADADDYMRLDLTAPASVKLKLARLREDASLELLDQNGNTIAESDNADNVGESIIQTLNPGTYYVHVASEEEGVGTRYALNISTRKARGAAWQAPASQPQPEPQPQPQQSTTVLSGQLDGADRTFGDGTPFDEYRFVAAASGPASVVVRSNAFAPYVEVRTIAADGSESTVNYEANGAMNPSATVQFDVVAGVQYSIRAGEVTFATGSYSVEASASCTGIAPFSSQPSPGSTRQIGGQLDGADRTFSDGTPYDSYEFTATGNGTATITVSSSAFAPYLVAYEDGNDSSIALETNSQMSGSATVSFSVTAGTHYTLLAGQVAFATGSYTLTYSALCDGIAPVGAEPAPDTSRQIVGQLDSADLTFGDGTSVDPYEFTAVSDGTATISVDSNSFAPYLAIYDDAAGATIATENNDQMSSSASVSFPVHAGSHYMVMAGEVSLALGTYTLRYSAECDGIAPLSEQQQEPPVQTVSLDQALRARRFYQLLDSDTAEMSYSFYADGSFQMDLSDQGQSASLYGSWKTSGNHLSITINVDSRSGTLELDVVYDPTTDRCTVTYMDNPQSATWVPENQYTQIGGGGGGGGGGGDRRLRY